EVVDAVGQALQVTAAVAVGVEVGLDVEAVDDRALPPQVAGVGDPHGQSLPEATAGSTCSPKVSMNSCCRCPTWYREMSSKPTSRDSSIQARCRPRSAAARTGTCTEARRTGAGT